MMNVKAHKIKSILFFSPLDRRMEFHPPRGVLLCKNKIVQTHIPMKEKKTMAACAIAYGFRLYTKKNIRNHEEDYTWIEDDCYMTNGDYAMFEEILEKEF